MKLVQLLGWICAKKAKKNMLQCKHVWVYFFIIFFYIIRNDIYYFICLEYIHALYTIGFTLYIHAWYTCLIYHEDICVVYTGVYTEVGMGYITYYIFHTIPFYIFQYISTYYVAIATLFKTFNLRPLASHITRVYILVVYSTIYQF